MSGVFLPVFSRCLFVHMFLKMLCHPIIPLLSLWHSFIHWCITHSHAHTFTHSHTHSFTDSLTHLFTHTLSHTLTHTLAPSHTHTRQSCPEHLLCARPCPGCCHCVMRVEWAPRPAGYL